MKVTYENRYWDQFNITKKDALYVVCAEITDEKLGKPELLDKCEFGLTTLGGITVGLPHEKINEILRFNYLIEEKGEVGLCRPYSLVITPRDFYQRMYSNKFDIKTDKYLSDIVEANEKYIQAKEIYFTFIEVNSAKARYWETEESKSDCLKNLEARLKGMKCKHTESANIDSYPVSNF